jgi:hypothetical protein
MTLSYQDFYDLTAALENEPNLIPSPELYPFDAEKLYAAMMEMAAQPLPSGEMSPFTSRLPGSVHAIIFASVLYAHQMLAHQMNLVADKTWVEYFRMLGMSRIEAEYPIIAIEFKRDRQSIQTGINVQIPLGTVVQNRNNSGFTARTRVEARMTGSQETVIVPATLSRLGAFDQNIGEGEFNHLSRQISFIESVRNTGEVISPGRNQETLPEMMLRARELLRTGMRCVTTSDFYYFATRPNPVGVGALKANILPGYLRGSDFTFGGSIVTVVLYPGVLKSLGEAFFEEMKMADISVDVVAAEIIPIDGEVTVRVIPSLVGQDNIVFNLVARALRDRINPPENRNQVGGKWGDPQIEISVATALEMVEGIYAVPQIFLRHAQTGEPMSSFKPKPWHLFQIQSSLVIKNIP